MKPETLIYNKAQKVLLQNAEKTVFFIGITKTSQEVYFYSFIDGEAKQCYTLAEEYLLDENEMAKVFSDIVNIIRNSELYKSDRYNVGTLDIDNGVVKLTMQYYDMNNSEYRIQKNWIKEHIV